jgi:hypothetical protein
LKKYYTRVQNVVIVQHVAIMQQCHSTYLAFLRTHVEM